MNILLVEDNSDDTFLFEQAVRKAGVAVKLSAVADGAEAVSYLQGNGAYSDREQHPFPDVMLLDLNMPRMNGFEVLEWIRKDERSKTLIVHILSSSCRDVDVQRAYELHANGYVMKPSRMEELISFAKALFAWQSFSCRVKR